MVVPSLHPQMGHGQAAKLMVWAVKREKVKREIEASSIVVVVSFIQNSCHLIMVLKLIERFGQGSIKLSLVNVGSVGISPMVTGSHTGWWSKLVGDHRLVITHLEG